MAGVSNESSNSFFFSAGRFLSKDFQDLLKSERERPELER